VRFGKEGMLRYTSHLDLARVWERVARRASLPLLYTQGFNPRPRIQLAAGLPLGMSSTAELLDMWLEGDLPDPHAMVSALQAAAPQGLTVYSVDTVDLHAPALQALARSATYTVMLGPYSDRDALRQRISSLLGRAEVWRERRGKRYDLRRLIYGIELADEGEGVRLTIETALSQEGGTGRPDEVLEELGIDSLSVHITRTAISFGET
jgi:radical SAM-linked protein